MTRHFLMLHVTVKDGERALLTRNGTLERMLGPGRHRLFDPRSELAAETFKVVRSEFTADRYAVLKAARPDLAAELFEAVETARLLEGRDVGRCRTHRRDQRRQGRRAASGDDRA
jgi:hypothetical protein